MTIVHLDDFDPKNKIWNTVLSTKLENFDTSVEYPSKYGGVTRIRYVKEPGDIVVMKEVEKKEGKKDLTVENVVVNMEEDEVEKVGEESFY